MERLTIKNSDGSYSQPTHTTFEKLFFKMAEIEDVLEQFDIKDITDLKIALKSFKKAIIPKFKIGQEVWYIDADANDGLKAKSYFVDEIHIVGHYLQYFHQHGWCLNQEQLFTSKKMQRKI